mgnify:CR=1 FL=1
MRLTRKLRTMRLGNFVVESLRMRGNVYRVLK